MNLITESHPLNQQHKATANGHAGADADSLFLVFRAQAGAQGRLADSDNSRLMLMLQICRNGLPDRYLYVGSN